MLALTIIGEGCLSNCSFDFFRNLIFLLCYFSEIQDEALRVFVIQQGIGTRPTVIAVRVISTPFA